MSSDWRGSEPSQRILDLLDALRRIDTYTGGISREEFLADEMRRDATVRALEVLSEAVRHLRMHAPEYEGRYPDVHFGRIAGAGDIYRHQYGFVDYALIWNSIHGADVAAVRAMIRAEVPQRYLDVLGEES